MIRALLTARVSCALLSALICLLYLLGLPPALLSLLASCFTYLTFVRALLALLALLTCERSWRVTSPAHIGARGAEIESLFRGRPREALP